MMDLKGRSILLTGGAGFIGSHLSNRLLEMGCRVTVLDNFDDFYPGKESNVEPNLSREGYRFVKGDILDFEMLSSLSKNVDIIIHEAAQAGVQQCNLDPMKSHHVNVTGTLNVLLAARQNKVGKVVYASSSSVYGVSNHMRMSEDHPTNPTCPYGASKLAAEKYCLAFGTAYEMPVTCLRYFSVYGPRGRPDQVIYRFASKILKGEPPIIYGDGNQTRDFTFVDDIVQATILAAISDRSNREIINIGCGNEIRIKDVVNSIIDRLDLRGKIEPEYLDSYKGDFPRTLADNGRAQQILGWRPLVNFDEGLGKFLNWFSEAYPQVVQGK